MILRRQNQQFHWLGSIKFVYSTKPGIDQVYTALASVLAKHGLIILLRIVERTVTKRTTRQGGALFYVTVKAEFDFVLRQRTVQSTP